MAAQEILKIEHLSKRFGSNQVLRDVDFSVTQGEVVCIIGSSGSGKSTLLRCINLLEEPTGGNICYHGKDIDTLPVTDYRARVGMVFQQFNLFDNMTVLVQSGRRKCWAETAGRQNKRRSPIYSA